MSGDHSYTTATPAALDRANPGLRLSPDVIERIGRPQPTAARQGVPA